MKVAVTATGATLESPLDPRFGRCPYFLIVETDDLSFEALENPNISRGSGAGIQTAQLVAEKGAQVVLTGNCGPNAYQTLSAAGLDVIVNCSGAVRDAVESFKAGRCKIAEQPNVASHFGTGPTHDTAADAPASPQASAGFAPGAAAGPRAVGGGGMGMGAGAGMAMGMGAGRGGGGRGMGAGRGMGRGGGGGGGGGGRGMGMGQGMGRGGAFSGATPDVTSPPVPQQQVDSNDELAGLKAQARAVEEQLASLNARIDQVQNTTGHRLVAVVDAEQCTACGICTEVCAVGAITVNGAARVDVGKCIACGRCVTECPQGAIALRKA